MRALAATEGTDVYQPHASRLFPANPERTQRCGPVEPNPSCSALRRRSFVLSGPSIPWTPSAMTNSLLGCQTQQLQLRQVLPLRTATRAGAVPRQSANASTRRVGRSANGTCWRRRSPYTLFCADPCSSCCRLNKQCQPSIPVRKRNPRKTQPSRAAYLEEKLDDLVSLIRSQASRYADSNDATPPAASSAAAPPVTTTDSPSVSTPQSGHKPHGSVGGPSTAKTSPATDIPQSEYACKYLYSWSSTSLVPVPQQCLELVLLATMVTSSHAFSQTMQTRALPDPDFYEQPCNARIHRVHGPDSQDLGSLGSLSLPFVVYATVLQRVPS